ncbi:MAG: hypothetical protein WEA81_02885 [Dehalococcoidia bacterium]
MTHHFDGARFVRGLAVLAVGFVAGAATVMLADPGTEARRFSSDATTVRHDHPESDITYAELPKWTKAEVDEVITQWATRYATAADAQRDGWFRATRSLCGIGAHYIKTAAFSGAVTFDPLNPNILLFDGEGPDAKFAGVSWVLAEIPEEGFTGDFDSWHSHTSVCAHGGTIMSLSEEDFSVWLSERECSAIGGRVIPLDNDQMMHLWIGPEYIDDVAIFAHDHPKLFDGYKPRRDA